MKYADVKFLKDYLVIEVADGPDEGILWSLCYGDDVSFSARIMLNNAEVDAYYALGTHQRAELSCVIKQYLGALTVDDHIVVFTAEVMGLTEYDPSKVSDRRTNFLYPVLEEGMLITVIYDEMRGFGCVCRAMTMEGEEVNFIQSKPFIDYNIDAAPLMGTNDSLPDELQEVLDRLEELEEAEATGDTAGEPGDSGSGNPSDGKSGATTVTPAEPEDNFTMEPKDKSGS